MSNNTNELRIITTDETPLMIIKRVFHLTKNYNNYMQMDKKFYTYLSKFIVILLVFVVFIECQDNNTPHVPVKKLMANKKINMFGDSTYFSRLDGIRSWDNKFYILHSEAQRIVVLDTNLNFITAFGQKGKGPGEFVYATNIGKHDDYLYVSDVGNLSVFKNKNGKYCFEKEFKISVHTTREFMCFTILDEQIYTISSHETKPIQVLSLNGDKIKQFGQYVEVDSKHYYRNLFYLDSSPEAGIVAVSHSEPIVMHFNKNGKLLNQLDLSNLEILQETIAVNREYYKTADLNSYSFLFSNICLQKNKLYLKMVLRDEKMKNTRNKILVLDVEDNKIEPERILELEDSFLDIICVSPDNKKLVAFDDIFGELLIFNL